MHEIYWVSIQCSDFFKTKIKHSMCCRQRPRTPPTERRRSTIWWVPPLLSVSLFIPQSMISLMLAMSDSAIAHSNKNPLCTWGYLLMLFIINLSPASKLNQKRLNVLLGFFTICIREDRIFQYIDILSSKINHIIKHNFIRLLPETCIPMFISDVDIYN